MELPSVSRLVRLLRFVGGGEIDRFSEVGRGGDSCQEWFSGLTNGLSTNGSGESLCIDEEKRGSLPLSGKGSDAMTELPSMNETKM